MQRSRVSLLPLLLVTLLLFLVGVGPPVSGVVVDIGDQSQEDVLPLLHDDTFDAHVFSKGSRGGRRLRAEPWLIIFIAPWCGHCKTALPRFASANSQLTKLGTPRTRLAMINVVKSPELALRFRVKEYPTIIYTTGKGENWHVYRGALTTDTLVMFATRLQKAAAVGSFADLTSSPAGFVRAHKQDWGRRVPMYVFLPPTNVGGDTASQVKRKEARNNETGCEVKQAEGCDRLAEAREARWNVAVDAAASMEKIRFGVVYGDDVPATWAETGIPPYVAVLGAIHRCKGSGPDGALLVVDSDAYKQPQCYEGPWFVDSVDIPHKDNKAGSMTPLLHPAFVSFLLRNRFHAVERASSSLLAAIAATNHHYLGLLITDGPATEVNANLLPVLREVVREQNEARRVITGGTESQRRVSLAYVDGRAHAAWRTQYKVELEELPAFVVVDPRRDKVYRLNRHTPHFEVIKSSVPWPRGGEQQSIIISFIADVERGNARGEKMTFIGEVAEHLLRLPGVEFLYEAFDFEDSLLVVAVLSLFLFSIVLLIVLIVEPMFERSAGERLTRFAERDVAALARKRN